MDALVEGWQAYYHDGSEEGSGSENRFLGEKVYPKKSPGSQADIN